jgi:hypothetical protein
MSMDSVTPAALDGFVEIRLRNGRQELVRVAEIISVRARTEGGCALRYGDGRLLLLDADFETVLAAMRKSATADQLNGGTLDE